MSEIQKCPNLVRGGGQHFSKMSQIQKCPKGRKGSTLIGTLSQIFSIFYFDASPYSFLLSLSIPSVGWILAT